LAAGAAEEQNRSCLLPYLDMLNHSSSVRVECRWLLDGRYELWQSHPAVRMVHPGQEVLISYGLLSNAELLARYGFALPHNEHDAIKLSLHQLEAFLTTPQKLLTEEQQQSLGEPWPRFSLENDAEAARFARCPCGASPVLNPALPRWARALPGLPAAMEAWQLELLRHCGLYELAGDMEARARAHEQQARSKQAEMRDARIRQAAAARAARGVASAGGAVQTAPGLEEEKQAAASLPAVASASALAASDSADVSTTALSFTLSPCTLPSDLATFLRVRLLSHEEAQVACNAAAGGTTRQPGAHKGRAGPAQQQQQLDLPHLASVLLDESAPYVSPAHRLLVQRVTVELLLSCLNDKSALGRSSIQDDLREWTAANLPYVSQQALLLRLTHKRLLCSLIAHTFTE